MINILKELNIPAEEYFLTGSRALDTENLRISSDDSDYDYVVMINNRHIIINYLISKNIIIEYSGYNGGFKFVYENEKYNIITVVNIEFMAWRESLDILKY